MTVHDRLAILRGRIEMAEVRLGRTNCAKTVLIGSDPERLGKRGDFDGITKLSSCPMSLYVCDRGRIDAPHRLRH